MKIGYLGPQGTFSEKAVVKYVKEHKLEAKFVPAHSHFELFNLFNKKKCDLIIAPVENSVEGSINITLDLLTHTKNITIIEEIILSIKNSLLGKGIKKLSDITDIISHPQPLAQCQKYLEKHFPHVQIHQSQSTAKAAELVLDDTYLKDGKKHKVAIVGNKYLAKIYDLEILAEDINDYDNNQTQFYVLGKNFAKATGNDKTSIVFSIVKDRPGGLYDILGEFAKRNINLTKISSRPTKEVLGDYLFFIDLEGHISENKVKDALAQIKKKASFFKILGSYKKDTIND